MINDQVSVDLAVLDEISKQDRSARLASAFVILLERDNFNKLIKSPSPRNPNELLEWVDAVSYRLEEADTQKMAEQRRSREFTHTVAALLPSGG